MEFKRLFTMINSKNEQIEQLEFERELLNRELLRLANGELIASRIHAKLTVEEFEKVVNKKGCIPITNITKYSYKDEFTDFKFKLNGMEYTVKFTTNFKHINEEFFDEATLDCFDIYISKGVTRGCVYTGFTISEIREKLDSWADKTYEEIRDEYWEYVKSKNK